jgi:hypothetical protein
VETLLIGHAMEPGDHAKSVWAVFVHRRFMVSHYESFL